MIQYDTNVIINKNMLLNTIIIQLAAEEKALEEKKRAKEDAAEQLERDLAAAADQLAQMASC